MINVEAFEVHEILGEGASLIRHNVLDLPQLLIYAACLDLSCLALRRAQGVLSKKYSLPVAHHFHSDN